MPTLVPQICCRQADCCLWSCAELTEGKVHALCMAKSEQHAGWTPNASRTGPLEHPVFSGTAVAVRPPASAATKPSHHPPPSGASLFSQPAAGSRGQGQGPGEGSVGPDPRRIWEQAHAQQQREKQQRSGEWEEGGEEASDAQDAMLSRCASRRLGGTGCASTSTSCLALVLPFCLLSAAGDVKLFHPRSHPRSSTLKALQRFDSRDKFCDLCLH